MSNLLERAKSYTPHKIKDRVFTQEELELFIALAKEEITLNQASNALNYKHNGSIYVNISKAFVQLVQRGLIEFKPFKNGKTINCKSCLREMIVLDDEHRTFCSNDCKISYDKDTKKATKILSWSAWQLFRHKMSLIQKKHKND